MIPTWIYKAAATAALLFVVYFQYQLLSNEKAAHQATKLANYEKLQRIAELNQETQVRVAELVAAKQRTVEVIRTEYKETIKYVEKTIKGEQLSTVDGSASMYVNVTVPGTGSRQVDSSNVPNYSLTATGADGTTLRLTDGAGQGYWNLRFGIETNKQQTLNLQKYVSEVCLK